MTYPYHLPSFRAKPEIANYEFTTLNPHLGVADIDNTSLLIADIPGLIEGASEGKGLGHEFLRHVERTGVLLHLIDAYNNDVATAYKTIRTELERHDKALAKRPEVVALTKIEGLDKELVSDILSQIKTVVTKKTPVFAISSQAHKNLPELLRALNEVVKAEKTTKALEAAENSPEGAVYTLNTPELAWNIEKVSDSVFVIKGQKIEKFARRTDFDDFHGRQRLRDIMKKMGITHQLIRQGAEPASKIQFGRAAQIITLSELED